MLKASKPEVAVSKTHPAGRAEIVRVGKFGAVGIINTAIDFGLYNLLSGPVGLTLVKSNIASTSMAMMFSFMANKKLVFQKNSRAIHRQAIIFFLVTAIGLYVIQNGTIILLTELWLTPVAFGLGLAHTLHITNHDQFIIKNSAKAIATILSLTWNYLMYKKVVFS